MPDELPEVKGLDLPSKAEGETKPDEISIGTQLELIERKLDKIEDDDDPKMEKLIELRNKLRREKRVRSLKRQLQAVEDGEDDGFY